MFGWLKPKSPLTAEERRWIEERFAWLRAEFGDQPLRGPVITPTEQFFPDHYLPTRECAEALFDRVCAHMGVDRSRVDLNFYVSPTADVITSSFNPGIPEGYALGVYYEEDGRIAVWLEQTRLDEPRSLVATIAHELGHVHLLADGHYDARTPDNERLTDLLTVYFGFGVFTANSAIREVNWYAGGWSGWQASRQGYLSIAEYAYALAVYADALGDYEARWAFHLRHDVRALFNAELERLASRKVEPSADSRTPTLGVANGMEQQRLAGRKPNEPECHDDRTKPEEVSDEDQERDIAEPYEVGGEPEEDESIPLPESNADALYTLAVAYSHEADYEQAVELYTEALELEQKDEEIWLGRAEAYLALGEFATAVEDSTQALRYSPDYVGARCCRAHAYLWLGRFSEAVDDLDEAQREENRDSQVYFLRALAHEGLGNYKQAVSDLNKCIRYAPLWADAYLARSRVYEALGDVPRAQSDLALAIYRDPALADEETRAARLPGE